MKEKRHKARHWVGRLGKPAILIVVVVAAVYWVKFSPIAVTSHRVERGPIVSEVMGTGTLEARISVTVSPKISGRMVEILVDQGDRVNEGDVMVRLEDTDLREQVAIAESQLETARSAIGRLQADKDRADAVAAQAQRDNRQTQSLFTGDAATRDEADRAAETLSVAKAELARAVAALSEGRSSVVSAENTLKYQQARMDDATIRAPFDGLIVRRQREAGDIVVPGSAILSLVSTDELWIEAWVDETQMSALRVGQPAKVVFRSEPKHPYPGEVARLGREADRETREFIVNVKVLQLPENWAVGQRAEVYIESGSKESATLVPPELLQVRDDQQGVFVNVEDKARWRPVTLGLRNAEFVEVVEGVEAGDIVVKPVKSTSALRDGQRVSSP